MKQPVTWNLPAENEIYLPSTSVLSEVTSMYFRLVALELVVWLFTANVKLFNKA